MYKKTHLQKEPSQLVKHFSFSFFVKTYSLKSTKIKEESRENTYVPFSYIGMYENSKDENEDYSYKSGPIVLGLSSDPWHGVLGKQKGFTILIC